MYDLCCQFMLEDKKWYCIFSILVDLLCILIHVVSIANIFFTFQFEITTYIYCHKKDGILKFLIMCATFKANMKEPELPQRYLQNDERTNFKQQQNI